MGVIASIELSSASGWGFMVASSDTRFRLRDPPDSVFTIARGFRGVDGEDDEPPPLLMVSFVPVAPVSCRSLTSRSVIALGVGLDSASPAARVSQCSW